MNYYKITLQRRGKRSYEGFQRLEVRLGAITFRAKQEVKGIYVVKGLKEDITRILAF